MGDDIEEISSIKYLAPRIYSSQYRAVTASDYSGIIPFVYPNVESVTSYGGEELDPPEYGKVFISIKPKPLFHTTLLCSISGSAAQIFPTNFTKNNLISLMFI